MPSYLSFVSLSLFFWNIVPNALVVLCWLRRISYGEFSFLSFFFFFQKSIAFLLKSEIPFWLDGFSLFLLIFFFFRGHCLGDVSYQETHNIFCLDLDSCRDLHAHFRGVFGCCSHGWGTWLRSSGEIERKERFKTRRFNSFLGQMGKLRLGESRITLIKAKQPINSKYRIKTYTPVSD